jgi:hypothetical protein
MPWKECSVTQERLRFVARLLDGEGMSEVCSGPGSLNRFSASLSGVSAGVRLPCGWAAG